MPRKGEWVRVYQRALRAIVVEKKVTGAALRILLYLISQRGYGVGQALKQGVVAQALGLSLWSVSQGLAHLCRERVVTRLRGPMGAWLYCVSKDLVLKGAEPERKQLKGKGKVVHLRQQAEEDEGR